MSSGVAENESRASEWGLGFLLAIGAFVVLNGVGWFFMGPSLATFEQDTGIPLAEFRAAYPAAAELLALQARNTAILLMGLGLLALAAVLARRRGEGAWPRRAGWVFVATLLGVGLSELAAGAIYGLVYLALGLVALVGQFLVHR